MRLDLGRAPADRGAGQDDRVRVDDPLQRRRLAAAPDRPAGAARLGEPGGEVLRPSGVREPFPVTDRRVHRDGDGQGAGGDQVVDHRRDGVDADVPVEAAAGELLHRVRDEVLRAEALFDVGEVFVGRLDEVRALPPDGRGLAQAVGGERAGGGGGGPLAGAFEGVEAVVIDARLLVIEPAAAAGLVGRGTCPIGRGCRGRPGRGQTQGSDTAWKLSDRLRPRGAASCKTPPPAPSYNRRRTVPAEASPHDPFRL